MRYRQAKHYFSSVYEDSVLVPQMITYLIVSERRPIMYNLYQELFYGLFHYEDLPVQYTEIFRVVKNENFRR